MTTAIPDRNRRPVPWRVGDLLLVYVLNMLGAVLLLSGWFQVSGAVTLRAQLPGANVATAGIIIAGFGNVMWLVAGRRSVGELKRHIIGSLRREPVSAHSVDRNGRLVAGAGMTRFHREGCPLVAGKTVRASRRERHLTAGRRPCDICGSEAVR